MKYDNPAARLLAILERGKEFKPDRNCRECWEELLEAKGDSAMLMARLGLLMALPQCVVSALIHAYPTQGNTWAHWEGQVSAAFMAQNMHADWKSFAANIDNHSYTYLRLAADLLNAKDQAQLLERDQVAEVRLRVQEALDAVIGTDIPRALKAQVVRCMKRVLDAMDEYHITGGVGVLEAAEAALGHASVDSEYKSFLQNTEIGQKALDAIAAAANLLTISVGIPQLTVVLTQLLTQ